LSEYGTTAYSATAGCRIHLSYTVSDNHLAGRCRQSVPVGAGIMKHIRPIVIGASIAVLGVTGVSMAASNQSSPIKKAKTHSVADIKNVHDSTDTPVLVQTTTSDVKPTPAITMPQVATTTTTDSPAPSPAPQTTPLQDLQQTVTTQATAIAPLFGSSNQQAFIDTQWRCLSRGLSDTSEQSQLDAAANVLAPTQSSDGRTVYRYFDGACRLTEIYR
jgi:hypothetical protein